MASPAKSISALPTPKADRRPKRQTRNRKPLRDLPLPSQSSKKRRRQETPEKLFPIRNIVDENETCYLIDWEDNSVTGESYEKTWEPKRYATQRAIDEWEATKQSKSSKTAPESSPVSGHERSTQDSEPVRAPTRKRPAPESQSSPRGSLDQYLSSYHKRPRKAGTVHSARFSFSQEEEVVSKRKDEIADSFEEDTQLRSKIPQSFRVVIPYNSNFDREAYTKAPASSFSDSPATHSSLGTSSSLPGTSNFEREAIIPDSQELTEYSPCQLSKHTAVSPGVDIAPNTTTCGESGSESVHAPVSDLSCLEQLDCYLTSARSLSDRHITPRSNQKSASLLEREAQQSRFEEQAHSAIENLPPTYRGTSEELQFQTQVEFLRESRYLQDNHRIVVERSPKDIAVDELPQGYVPFRADQSCKNSVPSQNLEALSSEQDIEDRTQSSSDEPWQGAQVIISSEELGSHFAASENSHLDTTERTTTESVQSHRINSSEYQGNSPEDVIYSIEQDDPISEDVSVQGSFSPLSSGASRFPDTYNGDYPTRPDTPSEIDMGDEEPLVPGSSMSIKDRIRRKREEARAKLSTDRSTRSPSELPPKTSSPPPPTSMTQMLPATPVLPIREQSIDQLMPSVEELQSTEVDNSSPQESLASLQLPHRKSTERVVLLPIVSMVRDVYQATLRNNRQDIKALLVDHQLEPTSIQRIDAMVQELKLLTDHQDLIADATATQRALPNEFQSKWAESSSSKCLFVREFLDSLRPHEKHIAILARPGRMLDILEAIMKANKYSYVRPDMSSGSSNGTTGALKVTLLPTGLEGPRHVVPRADAVIAFDDSFWTGEMYSQILRAGITEPRRLSLLISLMVTNSAEHVELCLSKDMDFFRRRRSLVGHIWQKRHDLGRLEGYPLPDQAAVAIAQYMTAESMQYTPWPLPETPDIGGVGSPSDEQTDPQSGSTTQSRDDNQSQGPIPPSLIKRPLIFENNDGTDVDSTKRMRMTPSSGDITSSGDVVTRASESLGPLAQGKLSTDQEMKELVEVVIQLDDTESVQITSLHAKVAELQSQVQQNRQREEKFEKTVKDLESRLDDYVATVRKIQPKYRAAIKERALFEQERDRAQAAATIITQRIEARIADITKLREEKSVLQSELSAARVALSDSDVPQVADFAKTQDQVRTLEAEKTRLEKRLSSVQKDFEFTRELYQNASTSAADSAREVSELKEQRIALERKASDNMLHIAEFQRSNATREREERIAELEALLKDREWELRKKNEELKLKTNGRRETRGTSVPRSPRMGSGAMSPRPQYARTAGGSRQNSPAPGDPAREGFRDANLYPPSGSHRWQHLT